MKTLERASWSFDNMEKNFTIDEKEVIDYLEEIVTDEKELSYLKGLIEDNYEDGLMSIYRFYFPTDKWNWNSEPSRMITVNVDWR